MARHDERDCRLRLQMLDMLAGESRILEASRFASTLVGSQVEMGTRDYGLCCGIACYTERS